MAVYLYRLGRLAARRAWAVVLVWILVVAAVGGAAAALQKPFTSKLSIPGTEFQQVLDDLDRSLPDAAGGSAGVVFSTKDGAPFTQEQKNAVARVTKAWSGIQGVDEASNPFATQQDLDEGRSDLAEGKTKLADAEKEIRENAKKIADGKVEIADGRAKIDENADKLADGERQLDEGAAQLADGEAAIVANARKLEQGRAELERNQAKIDDGKEQLAAGRAELDAGQRKLDAGKAQLADGENQLAAARAKVEAGEKQLAPAQAKIAAGRKQIAAARAELADARSRLEAGRAQVAAQRAELEALKNETDAPKPTDGDPSPSPSATDAPTPTPSDDAPAEEPTSTPAPTSTEAVAGAVGVFARVAAAPDPERIAALEAQIAAATERLNASEAEITKGEQALQQSAQLDAGAAQLKQQSAPLVAARRTLDQKTAELAAGKREIAANQRNIDAGRATLREKTAELTAGERKLQAGWAQLRDGEAQLAAGREKLDAGKAEIAANRAKLSSGKAQLAQGRVDLDAAAKQLKDGEAKLSDGRTTIAEKTVELRQGERRLALMDGLRSVSKDGHVAMANVSFDAPLNEVPQSTKDELPASAGALDAAGVRVDYSKDIAESISVGGASEVVGIVLAAIVLIVMLGSLLAAGLPLLIAMIGVGTGVAGMLALTHWVEMTDVTPALAVMLGLAVGIDYALFIVHRHRQTLASGEVDVQESIGRAVGTAGSAVLFAGMTVVVALAALTVTGIPFLGVMGLAAAATVATSVLVALTLTPALLSLMGPRVLSPKARRALKESWAQEESEADAEEAGEPAASRAAHHAARGRGWGGLVTRHPVIAVAASVLLLGLVALPAASLKLGLPDASQEAHDSTAYRTYSTISQAFGPGQNAAILAVAKVDPAQADAMTDDQVTELQLTVAEQLKAHDDVEYVVPAAVSDDHRTLVYQIVPGSGPNDDATQQLIHELRDERGQIVDATAVDSIGFAGQTVANIDMSELLADALPKYLAVVVGISILLLLLVFRSVIVPLLATGGFLLSVAASFGAVVAVYQWGWLGSVFGVSQPGVILSFLPTLVIGILFGLAMDYQMFLVSGMREAWAHGHAARTAVRTGFSHGAKVVTAAALIMVGVFAGFVHAPSAMIRPIGFALAAGVIFDAFVVRMTIMPALMHLLGERAWYLPAWLGRILPDLDVEGTKLLAQRAADEQATLEEQGREREPSTV
ncbi:MMPL family transporter [Agilicoccus flavus]|uniref:MMPL family transporter n=1 Tax=Agilicoccus flavus TaxID=2775968 RepID=UPI001CF63D9E|nr:MMPL family transporter [Agilicoccus flavus]